MRFSLLAAGVLVLTGAVASAADTPYRLEYDPLRDIDCTLVSTVKLSGASVKEWMFYQLTPPEIGRQRVTLKVEPGNGFGAGQEGTTQDAPRLPLVYFDKIYPAPQRDAQLTYTLSYKGTLNETRLVELKPGEKAPAVAPLSAADAAYYTRRTDTYDYDSPTVKQWLDQAGLHRKAGERDLDFARRVFLSMRGSFEWNETASQNGTATAVVKDKKAVCAGLSIAFCAAMRANGVPTRVTSLILANRDMHQADTDGHATNEFFAQGIGWVPCDLTGGCSNKDDEAAALSYFAHDDGSYIVLFYDVDNFTVDTTRFGSRAPVIAPTAFRKNYAETVQDLVPGRFWGLQWCIDGQYESKQTTDWTAHVKPNPQAREHLDAEGEGVNPGFPAWFKVWHDDAGWHVRTGVNDGKPHMFQITVASEYGTIEHFREVGAARDLQKVNQSTLAIGYQKSTPFGIDFAASDKTRSLKFNLRIDRKTTWDYPALFIGKDGSQPLNNPFVLVPAQRK